jgi:hypothetical protein
MDQVGPDPRLSGPKGWPTVPTPWSTGQGLRRFHPKLGCHAPTRGGEARVDGGRSTRSAGHHLAPKQPLQVDRGPIHSYKYPPHGESRHTHTHHILEIPLAKLSFLV